MRSASDCTGDTESLLRSFDPTFSDLIFNLISLEYHESLMAPSGDSAEKSLNDAISKKTLESLGITLEFIPRHPGNHLCFHERSR